MKQFYLVAFLAIILMSCVSPSAKKEIVGVYHRPWFHSDIVLTLELSGDYSLISATLKEDGIWGNREVGVWALANHGLKLHPTSNSYSSEFDGLRELTFVTKDGKQLLTPSSKDLPFEKEKPNQALQHNDPSCHAPCVRTCRASRGRG